MGFIIRRNYSTESLKHRESDLLLCTKKRTIATLLPLGSPT
jgi:hypothetical protein